MEPALGLTPTQRRPSVGALAAFKLAWKVLPLDRLQLSGQAYYSTDRNVGLLGGSCWPIVACRDGLASANNRRRWPMGSPERVFREVVNT
ncbi:hypothetical protein D3C72_2074160 [compost metagenome]